MKSLMIQGTTSGAGKTILVTALCRIFSDKGYRVAPFKSQNMSNFGYSGDKFEISRAQAIQAIGARCKIAPELNPILLKPVGNYFSKVYVNGKYFKKMHAKDYYQKFALSKGLDTATHSLSKLKKHYDLVILEGAGSPAEINLQKYDIANMMMAQKAQASVILVSDIDRGGSFASLVGTMDLLPKKYHKYVQGFIFNKFRGDLDVLKPGFDKLRRITHVPVLGTIPMIPITLPEEDSLDGSTKEVKWTQKTLSKIDNEISNLSKTVMNSLNLKYIEKMLK